MAAASHIRHRTAPRPGASLQGGSGVQRGRDRTISPGHPVIACIACMRSHTHTHTHTHTANNRSNRSDPHAARMQHPPQHHREVLRRSSGAARKDSCTACERTAFTPCRRTHSAAHTRRRWREEPTSTWPHRRQARRTRCTLAPSTPPPAPARAASTMVKGPHHTTHSGSAPPSLRTHSSSAHPDAQPKPCNAWPRHGRAPTPPAQTPRPP